MKRNTARKILLVLVALWFTVVAFQPPAYGLPAAIPTPQLTISKVVAGGLDTPYPTLAIEGNNFGDSPSVYMGVSGGVLTQLTVAASTNNFISAQLTVFDRHEVPIQADARWLARQKMQVRAFLVDDKFEKSMDTFHIPHWHAHAPTRLIFGNRCGSVTKR